MICARNQGVESEIHEFIFNHYYELTTEQTANKSNYTMLKLYT